MARVIRIIALLSFYDEQPAVLVQCLKSLRLAGVSHVVAVDGAYALYPNGEAASHPMQHAAITLACRELGFGCTLSVPSAPWTGNEVEKRNALFALGWAVAQEGDWFWIQDADMVVTRCPEDLSTPLAATEHQAAEVEILDVVAQRAKQTNWPERFVFRGLFKAQPITVGPRHCVYTNANGDSLWNGNGADDPMPYLDLSADVLIEHRPDERTDDRQLGKMRYYAERDARNIERGECKKCGAPSARLVATRWRMSRLGPVAEWREACETHAREWERVGRVQLSQLGVDPDSVAVENRMGKIPAGVR